MPTGWTPALMRIGVVLWALVAVAAAADVLHSHGETRFLDLHVYEWAAHRALDGRDLYQLTTPGTGLAFTYTPFAALVFWALDQLSLLGSVAWSVVSLAALARTSVLLARDRGRLAPSLSTGWAALLIGSSILVLGPALNALALGQVAFVLLWLVCEDLLVERRRSSGVLVGLATACKLTPGIYLVMLALVARWRTFALACVTVAATVLLGLLAMPASSRSFWTGVATRSDRVGATEYVSNQSLDGLVWRIAGPGGSTAAWLALAILFGGAALLLSRRWWNGEERVGAVGLAGLAGLYVSPISWDHHWVMVAPLLVALLGSPRRRPVSIVTGLVAGAILASRVIYHVPHGNAAEFHHSLLQALGGNAYLIAGTLLLLGAWFARPLSLGPAAVDDARRLRSPTAPAPASAAAGR